MDTLTLSHPQALDLTHQKIWTLSPRQLLDVECILNGAFHPLTGFLEQADYEHVCQHMRLCNGSLWPMPITLDVPEQFAQSLTLGEQIILTTDENTPLALLTLASKWQPNKHQEAQYVLGTEDLAHPAVNDLFTHTGAWYLGGKITALTPIVHYDFHAYRHTPAQLKQLFQIHGWSTIVAFQTRNPIHRAHYELTLRATQAVHGHLLIHPVVGITKPGDIDSLTRVQCYEHMLTQYPHGLAMLSVLPLAMRMAGPREALWHALIRKNYGATHFIIGRDHAGPGKNSHGQPFYAPYAAQQLVRAYADEMKIEILHFPEMVYVQQKAQFLPMDEVSADDTTEDISGTELRRRLEQQLPIPDWYSFPEVLKILQLAYPPKHRQGFTLFFTGLSGAGKSTLAKALCAKLRTHDQRRITLLDGDLIRQHLSSELGFSKQDRDKHIQRMGFVAAEITKHGGVAICAAIAPYTATRQLIRERIAQYGGFIEIYVATPIVVCKQRDIKGLYKKAEMGLITEFTGVSDPYQKPTHADVVIDTSTLSLAEAIDFLVEKIERLGYIKSVTHKQ